MPSLTAPAYLLRVNEASGPPGSVSPIHSHPGSEVVYVLAGEESFRTPHGIERVGAGNSNVGASPDTPMEASSSGTTNLHAFIMFVVDASQPFSRPARFPERDNPRAACEHPASSPTSTSSPGEGS